VTPDMHRIHHSSEQPETDSNYGFNLAVWDRLFATYTQDPMRGHDDIEIGLKEYQDQRPTRLPWSLSLPFRT
ncbi:MAG: sterol desaturase family protein, partial [Pseudomonadota bacterium]